MSKQKETTTITMTEEQLKSIISEAVLKAIRQSKAEEELPINDENELEKAPASFALMGTLATGFLITLSAYSCIFIYGCGTVLFQPVTWYVKLFALIAMFDFIGIIILSISSIRELFKTKKIEVINSVFNAIMAISGLIVAIVGAVFAYQALK